MLRVSVVVFTLGLGVAGCAPFGPQVTAAPTTQAEAELGQMDAAVPDAHGPVDVLPVTSLPAPNLPATTIASLGNVRETGLWMRTPLVSSAMRGRVRDPTTGRSVPLELLPLEGAPGAGSRMSMEAYQALGLPLTALPELQVSAEG